LICKLLIISSGNFEMKHLSYFFISNLVAFAMILQTVIAPDKLWFAMAFGAFAGFAARLALDVSKNGKKNLNKVFFESIAVVFVVSAIGMLILECLFYYFAIREKIETHKIIPEIPMYAATTFSFITVMSGRSGVEYAVSLLKTVAEKAVNANVKGDGKNE
jgi:H+/Cl- antiporter ClcA